MNYDSKTRTLMLNQNECMLPKDMKPSKDVFEGLGFVFEEVGDKVLYKVTLPTGWQLKVDCGNWLDILDAKGRERGGVFYKNNFMENRGHMYLTNRFYIHTTDGKPPYSVFVKDDATGQIIFVAGRCKSLYSSELFALEKKAKEFLDSHYPDWRNPAMYWD